MAITKLVADSLGTGVGGKVLQVVQGRNNYGTTYTTTSATDLLSASGTTWEVSITPTSSSSKILILETLFLVNSDDGNSTQEKRFFINLNRKIGAGSYSSIRSSSWYGHYYYQASQKVDLDAFSHSESILDEPATTSQVTYKYQIGGHGTQRTINHLGDNKYSVINLLEIAG
jgi:hypothetical protein